MSRRARSILTLATVLAVAATLVPAGAGAAATERPSRSAGDPRHDQGAQRFDLQAHRGGIGLTVENTLASFGRALGLGVSTLELDVQVTQDGHAVVTHDRDPNPRKCLDTAPAFAGDPEFPYVPGTRYIKDLTLEQVRTLDCGTQTLPEFPNQQASPRARMPMLSEVFALVNERRARQVTLNVEIKVEAGAPEQTAPREQFVQEVAREVKAAGLNDQVSIQSFDWGALMRMREVMPDLPIVALTNGQQFLQAGQPGASPWLGGIDIDDFDGDLVAAAASFDSDAISPVHGDPQNGKVTDAGYRPYTTRTMVQDAHAAGMHVIPWTVDDVPTMQSLIDIGVDGLITDYPDRLRQLMAENGYKLPKAYPAARRQVRPLAQAHAHNDYEHTRPLQDALDHGFTSVEADVWLVGGELLVGHDATDLVPGRTLQSLYLDPLVSRVRERGGEVYSGRDEPLQLLVDIKNTGAATYTQLDQVLRRYRPIITRYAGSRVDERAVSVVISGDRPRALMEAQKVRLAAYDGRLTDLGSGAPASFVPLISSNWNSTFTWRGAGTMPADQRATLRRIVDTAHANGQRVRFWETPDVLGAPREAVWSELRAAGVDHLNTDDLAGLQAFLTGSRRS